MTTVGTTNFDEYRHEQIANTIRQYQKVRSSLEFISNRLDRVGKSSCKTAKEELMCLLIDIDEGIKYLTPRQQRVVLLLQQGYQYDEIGVKLGIRTATVASHACQAVTRLTNHLNQRNNEKR